MRARDLVIGARKAHGEARSTTISLADTHVAAVANHEVLHHRQPDAGAGDVLRRAGGSPVERLPDAHALLRWNARALVIHPDAYHVAILCRSDGDVLAMRTVLRGILQEV